MDCTPFHMPDAETKTSAVGVEAVVAGRLEEERTRGREEERPRGREGGRSART
jgi:hypothetical protein